MSALPAPSVALDQLALAALRWPRCALPSDGAAAEPPADDAVLHVHPNPNPNPNPNLNVNPNTNSNSDSCHHPDPDQVLHVQDMTQDAVASHFAQARLPLGP